MKAFLSFFESFRERHDERPWLLVHQHGEYEYRNPNSLYVHRFETFSTKEAALDHLERRIAKADQDEWTLYRSEDPSSHSDTVSGTRSKEDA